MTTPAEYTWKPIDSAPKDGTVINVRLDCGTVTTVSWQEAWPRDRARGWFLTEFGANADDTECCNATHWCPIIPFPKDLA